VINLEMNLRPRFIDHKYKAELVKPVSGRYAYPIHTGDGLYTYREGGRASSCVAELTRE